MPHAEFVHLRLHTAYSLSQGAVRIGELVELCRKHAMPAVGISDTGNLFGALEFALAASKAGVQPIVGTILGLRRPVQTGRNGQLQQADPDQLLLIAQSERGYRNLMALVSKAFLETQGGEPAQVGWDALDGATDGVIALTGGPAGTVGRLLLENQGPAAEEALLRLAALFPGRLYVELMRHGMREQDAIEAGLVDLAYRHDLPLVATNDVHFADAGMFEAHDALMCIAQGRRVEEENRPRLTPDHRFKSAAEMRTLFADLPEAVENTLVIARRCAFMPLPHKPILPNFPTVAGRTEAEELIAQAQAGLDQRLETHVFTAEMSAQEREAVAKPYRERLAYEAQVIENMGFPGYFLIVSDFIKWAKDRDIPVGPGRGSGAGSVVAWALTITDLDPLRFGLLFERFLNPERVSMPDFDIDFCQDRRDEVIRYVQDKYGHDKVAQIITFGKLQARAVLRDVGRVLGMPYGQTDRICKLVPNNPANPVTLQQAIDGEPQLQEMRRKDEAVKRLIDIALKLEGLYRHASTHAAGIVIGDRPLQELVPLYRDPKSDMPVTQFNMKYVETAGLVKFDFLGLKTLTVLQHAVRLLHERGLPIELETLPLDDAASYELLGRGHTVAVFQLEGAGMRDMLKRLRPNRIEDIIAVVALYRPGPMENIPSYINRKHGLEEPDYLYPTLEPILKETYGIIIYQEQVMQIAQELSGYSLGAADLLRRAMGKKIKAEMAAQRVAFVDGAKARGVEEKKASEIFDLVDKFAGYGFNKSHAAAYALVAYHTAYLKANHTVEFMAATMTYDMHNTDKLNAYRQDLKRFGLDLLPPDINRSGDLFTVEDLPEGGKAVRHALAAIKNVGRQAMAAIVAERGRNGPFKDLFDFARRLDMSLLNKRQLENLARAGAFDCFGMHRAGVVAAIDTVVRYAVAAADERASQQVSLFGGASGPEVPRLPEVDRWSETEKLQYELDAIGFYLSAHPVDAYRTVLERAGAVPISELQRRVGAGTARLLVGGTVVAKTEKMSQRGSRYAFIQLSDSSGIVEMSMFSEVLSASREILEAGKPILCTVEAKVDGETLRVGVQKVEDLDRMAANSAAGLRIALHDPRPIERLKALLEPSRRGRGKVVVVVGIDDGREVELELPGTYSVSPSVSATLRALPGVIDVTEAAL
ncbi:DNA polymerase-3 subunit alpha [Constrictibacter sp. MBR-5]|jgi:DNA polymerase-3 subunit alpha|uniref:DNA polymerase III subunit alpha n=1 Tax=Constrictibacter sp. MBR-5 TaxID=3156467 RepID=UPI0033928702